MKLLLNAVGLLAVGLGVLGIFLPLLPTTPFLLLALACFARGSTRLHGWLLANPVFGRYLRDWEEGRGIPRRAKATILVLMWVSLVYSMTLVHALLLRLMLAAIGLAVTVYLLRFVASAESR